MNMHIPWKMRLRSGLQSSPHDSNFWLRRKFRDELDVAKPTMPRQEEDLDHLGALHSHHR